MCVSETATCICVCIVYVYELVKIEIFGDNCGGGSTVHIRWADWREAARCKFFLEDLLLRCFDSRWSFCVTPSLKCNSKYNYWIRHPFQVLWQMAIGGGGGGASIMRCSLRRRRRHPHWRRRGGRNIFVRRVEWFLCGRNVLKGLYIINKSFLFVFNIYLYYFAFCTLGWFSFELRYRRKTKIFIFLKI